MTTDPRDALARWGQRFYARGWMWGTAGNLSARLPDGTAWVTASGVSKGDLGRAHFLRVQVDGTVVEAPEGTRPSAETTLHTAIYGWSEAPRACLHVHTPAANLLTRLWDGDVRLPPIEMVKGLGVWDHEPDVTVPVFDNHPHVPDIAAEVATRFAEQAPDVPAFLIRDHGMTVWGDTVEQAANRVECLAYLCDIAVQARAADAVWW